MNNYYFGVNFLSNYFGSNYYATPLIFNPQSNLGPSCDDNINLELISIQNQISVIQMIVPAPDPLTGVYTKKGCHLYKNFRFLRN